MPNATIGSIVERGKEGGELGTFVLSSIIAYVLSACVLIARRVSKR